MRTQMQVLQKKNADFYSKLKQSMLGIVEKT